MIKKPKCVENGHSKLETTRKIEKREIGWCSYVRSTQPAEQHSKLPQIFREKKPSRKLLQKQACPLPLSHEKTSNNKEHVQTSGKRSACIAFKLYEI